MVLAFAALFLQIQVVSQSLRTPVSSAGALVQDPATTTSTANRPASVFEGSSRPDPAQPEREAVARRHVLAVGGATSDGRAEEKGTRTASGAVVPETKNSIRVSAPTAFKSKPEAPDNSNQVRTNHQKHLWYALIGVQHGAATFDAWSTRDSIESGQRRELNPLLRPFSHSGAIYGAIQVVPGFMDFLGYRMMGSRHRWMRRAWWLPQAGSAALYFLSGVHNLRNSP